MGQCISSPGDDPRDPGRPQRKYSLRESLNRAKRFTKKHKPEEPRRREETSERVRERDEPRAISASGLGQPGTSATREGDTFETVNPQGREPHAITTTTTPIEAVNQEVLFQAPEPLAPKDDQDYDDQDEEEEASVSEYPDPVPDDYPDDLSELFRNQLKALLEHQLEVKDQEFPDYTRKTIGRGGEKPLLEHYAKKRVEGDTMRAEELAPKQSEESEQKTQLPGEASTSSEPFEKCEFCPIQEISEHSIHKVEQLGSGGSGCVHRAEWHGADVAVKEFYQGDPREKHKAIYQETKTLSMLKHPSVVTLFGVCRSKHDEHLTGIVIEFVIGGSLKAQLRKMRRPPGRQGALDVRTKVRIALQAAHAMQYLHSRNIIHFDVKAENFLCDLRDLSRPVVKVADVGLSKHKIASFVTGSMRGTLPWMAPELFPRMPGRDNPNQPHTTDKVTDKVDVYSFAIVLWEIWSLGAEPYPDMSAADVLYRMLEGNLRPTIPKDCHPEWIDLMELCWHPNPVHRPDFSVISYKLECMLRP